MKKYNNLKWDEKLNISTESVDYSLEDNQNYGYDPTPYIVLERLLRENILTKTDTVVDYGCGKGRIGFFFNSQVGCKVIGIDHSKKLLEEAFKNLESYGGGDIEFIHSKAEDYIPDGANRLYFFNPFSTHVFQNVLKRISESYNRKPREILILFYYSTIEYKLYLQTEPKLELVESLYFTPDEIDNEVSAKLDIFRFKPYGRLKQ